MRSLRATLAICALEATMLVNASAEPAQYDIDRGRTVFAFITMKAGALSGLVENAVSTPSDYELELRVSDEFSLSDFVLQIDAASIDVQRPEILKQWSDAFVATGILDTPPDPMGSVRRNRARKAIMSEDSLDPERFPEITAKMTSVEPADDAESGHSHRLRFDLTIRDKTVQVDWPAEIRRSGGRIEVETFGALHFTDFGMKPYSSFFGAIRYQDEFHVFVHIEGQRPGEK